VVTELSSLVPVSIDAESRAGAPVAQRYGVRGYPTLLVVDASGREVGRIAGFVPPDEFLRRIQGIRKSAGK
jgi:thioredoxin-related protein